MKKYLKYHVCFLFAAMFILAAAFVTHHVQAASVKLTRKSFSVLAASDGVAIGVNTGYSDVNAEVRIYLNGKKVKTLRTIMGTNGNSTALWLTTIKHNVIYKVRVRPLYNGSYVGKWTKYRAFCIAGPSTVVPDSSKAMLKVTLPYIAGINYANVYISTSPDSGYQKIGKMKPGQSVYVSRYKGRALTLNTNYYFTTKVKLKDGTPCENFGYTKVYLYRTTTKGSGSNARFSCMTAVGF
ncbi:MAG: hypothetical protein IKE03_06645 [Blautia sp.]|nr:hypothetical protein [Blautia sp.]